MSVRWQRQIEYRRPLSILLSTLVLAALLVTSGDSRAGIADLPYRLVPGMTSSIGVDLQSLVASDSLIVWEDHRGGVPDIYVYDIDDAREFRASSSSDFRQRPATAGTTIIWVSGEDPRSTTIRGIDLAEGIEFSVTDETGQVDRPAMSEDLIAWQQRDGDRWVVQVVDRDLEPVHTLGESARNSGRPSVSGETVVWQEHDSESWSIRAFDSARGSTIDVTNGANDDQYPVISGNRVAFVRSPAGGGQPMLILADLDNGTEQVLQEGHYLQRPAIHGDLVVWEDWRSGLPDIYAYDYVQDETFAVARSQQATTPAVSDNVISWISGNDPANQRVQSLEIQQRLPTDPQEPPAVPSPDSLYIPETQHFVSAGFKAFWQAHGGPQVLGFPLTEEFAEEHPDTGEEIVVQYFERVRLEFHPEPEAGDHVRISRLGYEMRPEREAEPTEPFDNSGSHRYFPETGHGISHGFKEFWEDNGGIAIFGYPVTGEFIENGRTVQYFERARFEFDPESEENPVRLGLLGREALQDRGWIPLPPVDTTRIFE